MLTYTTLQNDNPMVIDLDMVVFDFETTGIHAMADEIVELGAVRINGQGKILGKYETLINPGKSIPAKVVQIHGITDEMVQGKPNPLDAIFDFLHFAANSLLVAHNAKFDGFFLQKYINQLYSPYPITGSHKPGDKTSFNKENQTEKNKSFNPKRERDVWNNFLVKKNHTSYLAGLAILDTVSLAKAAFPSLKSYSLMNLKDYLQIEVKHSHRSFDDARSAAVVLQSSIQQFPASIRFNDLWNKAKQSYVTSTEKEMSAQIQRYQHIYWILDAALNNNEIIWIKYSDQKGSITKRDILPLRLFINHTEPYIEAYCNLRKERRFFRLDRIELCRKCS